MLEHVDLPLILAAGLIGVASPGPSTLAIAGTSMDYGRRRGLALASGITCGSLTWSISAALGLGTVMLANAWVFEVLRWAGAAYLAWLAVRSARAALRPGLVATRAVRARSTAQTVLQGFALHVTNPKAILFFGALYSLGVPADATASELAVVVAAVGLQSALVVHGYALLFSNRVATAAYLRLRRWFEGAFAIAFGAASFAVLTAKLR